MSDCYGSARFERGFASALWSRGGPGNLHRCRVVAQRAATCPDLTTALDLAGQLAEPRSDRPENEVIV